MIVTLIEKEGGGDILKGERMWVVGLGLARASQKAKLSLDQKAGEGTREPTRIEEKVGKYVSGCRAPKGDTRDLNWRLEQKEGGGIRTGSD